MSSGGVPKAWWPSLLLITFVPTWFFLTGWDGGRGQTRHAVSIVEVDGDAFRLWRQVAGDGSTRWCAEVVGRASAPDKLVFVFRNETREAEFDAGLHCATDRHTQSSQPQLQRR